MKQLVIILLLSILHFLQAKACDCKGKETVKKAIKKSHRVVVGKIVAKENLYILKKARTENPSAVNTYFRSKYYLYSYTVEVTTVYKGKKKKKTINIVTGPNQGDCGYNFETGKEYIIYAKKTKYKMKKKKLGTYMVTNTCTRTRLVSDEELAAIEQYKKPKKRY